jgi:hypothetical protein
MIFLLYRRAKRAYKPVLTKHNIDITKYRGQAYDGAAAMSNLNNNPFLQTESKAFWRSTKHTNNFLLFLWNNRSYDVKIMK